MSQPGQRQTKKQKKALAFRTRQKTSKKKHKDLDDDQDALDFPIEENQDVAGLADLPLEAEEVSTGDRSGGRKGKAKDGGQHQPQPEGSKKRKREVQEVVEEKPRKMSKTHSTLSGSGVEDGDGQKPAGVKDRVQPQRFILFIGAFESCSGLKRYSSTTTAGNLKYSTTKDAILSHFSSCGTMDLQLDFFLIVHILALDPPPTVRLPTPKAVEPSSKSKGYAFLQFTDKKPLQQALRLHHSELEGRKINVELTAGGGGKSEHRVKKLQERNKGLHEQRVPCFQITSPLCLADHHSETSNREAQICCDGCRGGRSVRSEGTRTSPAIFHYLRLRPSSQQQEDVVDTRRGRPGGVEELQETEAAGEAKGSGHRCKLDSSLLTTRMYLLFCSMDLGTAQVLYKPSDIWGRRHLFVLSALRVLEEQYASSPRLPRGRTACAADSEVRG